LPENISTLDGHSRFITCIAWNPKEDILATGSRDSTVILWNIKDDIEKKVLDYSVQGQIINLENGVSALDWNTDGSLLATGTKTGFVRIWDEYGNLKLNEKGGSTILKDIKWNKSGTLIGGALYDQIFIWSFEAGKLKKIKQIKVMSSLSGTVDWQTDNTFSFFVYKDIQVFKVGKNQPIKTFSGHTHLVQSSQWDPQGKLLASGSQDNTVKVWSMDREDCLHDLKGHTDTIKQVKWSNTGPGTKYPNKKLFLASFSYGKTVKLWDVETGSCLHTLENQQSFVRSIDFSPDGRFLASGCDDRVFNIWCTQTGKLLKTHQFQYGINFTIQFVCWSNTANKIAVSTLSNVFLINVNGLQSKEEKRSILDATKSKQKHESNQGKLI
jgi:transducin (beta)-like 1